MGFQSSPAWSNRGDFYPLQEDQPKSKVIPKTKVRGIIDGIGLATHVSFHASDPDSLPPPVSFSPPNAPPISLGSADIDISQSAIGTRVGKKFSIPSDHW